MILLWNDIICKDKSLNIDNWLTLEKFNAKWWYAYDDFSYLLIPFSKLQTHAEIIPELPSLAYSQSGLWALYDNWPGHYKPSNHPNTFQPTINPLHELGERLQFGATHATLPQMTDNNSLPPVAVFVRRVLVHQIDVGQWVGAAVSTAATRHRAGEEEEDCWFRPLSLELGSAQGEMFKPT